MIPELTPAEIARFYSKIRVAGCGMRWAGPVNNRGYGRFEIYRDGKRVRILAHRLAYKLATGDDPRSAVVRHKCDIPPCCTPDCFLLGTQADNIQDAIDRDRLDVHGLHDSRAGRDARARDRLVTNKKRCSRCRVVKTLDEFHRASANVDGRAYWCKACTGSHQARVKRERAAATASPERRAA